MTKHWPGCMPSCRRAEPTCLFPVFDSGEIERMIVDIRKLTEDQLRDFENREMHTAEFDEDRFSCKCPRCGLFDSAGGDAP